ncbi:DUF397 domain-containing protein [Kitasatospora sp. NPDC056184]|uniref:DUF397 domain-containing protein n=1 Tax=Kitasatospora sp. NPDC056184 TaxID=3345738 RepID=UPI0035DD5226
MSEILWQKSSFSAGDPENACIELAPGADGLRLLRESDEPGLVMAVKAPQLRLLLLAAKAGEFDRLS